MSDPSAALLVSDDPGQVERPNLAHTADYDRLASLYDALGTLYSGGGIRRSKQEHLALLGRGQTVLYAGAGTGAECVDAAALGARVTVCDTSRRMLEKARRRFEAEELHGRFEQRDALSLAGSFDVVVAPYFLNVFDRRGVQLAIGALASQVKPGGRLISVDFRAPAGPLPFRVLQRLYYLAPQLLFLFLSRNPWHELYDYPALATVAQPSLRLTDRICTRTLGLPLFETIVWKKATS